MNRLPAFNLALTLAVLVALTGGCSRTEEGAEQTPVTATMEQHTTAPTIQPTAEMPATDSAEAHARAMQQATANPGQLKYRGKVVKIENAGGYSYIETEMDGQGVMLAASPSDARVGDYIAWGDYAVMRDFHSKALDRSFGQILFVSQVVPVGPPPEPETGKVKQVETGGGYTYIEVEHEGKSTWLAAPMTAVKAGDNINWSGGSSMTNFNSSSLDRTFDEIVFVSRVTVTD